MVKAELISILSNLIMEKDWDGFITKEFLKVMNDSLQGPDEFTIIANL
jgi:hypothetical protein